MLSQYKWMDFRALLGLVVIFGACGYEPPSAGGTSSSSSSSSGMGGDGGTEASSSSSSTGMGGMGGMGLIGGAGGVGIGGVGGVGGDGGGLAGAGGGNSVGGSGGMGGGNTGGSGGGSSGAQVEICNPNSPCQTKGTTVCCMPKAAGSTGVCHPFEVCPNPLDYALKCDDVADCADGEYCCMKADRATCTEECGGMIVCKSKADCPAGQECGHILGSLIFCQIP